MKSTPAFHRSKGSALTRAIGLIAVASLIAAVIIYFSAQFFMNKAAEKAAAALPAPAPEPIPEPTPPPPPPEPAGLGLARLVRSEVPADRQAAIVQLAQMTEPQPEAVEMLSQALPTSLAEIKIDVLRALGALAKNNPAALDAVVKSLTDPALRMEAIKTAGDVGPAAVAAVPALKQIAFNKKESKTVRKAAGTALAKIQPQSKAATKGKKSGKKKKRKS